jgi:hypothetical protein
MLCNKNKVLFEPNSNTRQLVLGYKLQNINMEGTNMEDFLLMVKDPMIQNIGMGDTLHGNVVLIVSNVLLDEYEAFVHGMYSQDELPTFDKL